MKTVLLFILLICLFTAAPLRAQDAAAPEQFLAAWNTTIQTPAQAGAAWASLADAQKSHELGMLARVVLGIVRLRDGAEPKAVRELFVIPDAPAGAKPTELRRRASDAGKAMLARIAMESLADKLKAYYQAQVEYPATLGDLVTAKIATAQDITDPFGQTYGYETRARLNVARQAFTLTCITTQSRHGPLKPTLEKIAQRVTTHAITSLAPQDGQAYIRRASTNDGRPNPAQRWNLGQTLDEMTLWAVYDNYLIFGHQGLPRVMVKE